jgi:trans-aconitate 2-methyltransferase
MGDRLGKAMNSSSREWDAETYDKVSDPQFNWGIEVLERLELRGDENAVDAGCGSGRVTERLVDRLPDGSVLAVDGSQAMIAKARERLGDRVAYLVADLSDLELPERVDLVFSTATFHWILDHDRLFARIRDVLRPGGRLVAQCGGEGNVAKHAVAIATAASNPEYAQHFGAANALWNFAGPEETEARLRNAGFDWSPGPSSPRTRSPSPRRSPSGRCWRNCPRRNTAPSWTRSSPRRSSRSSSTTCASTSRPSPPEPDA